MPQSKTLTVEVGEVQGSSIMNLLCFLGTSRLWGFSTSSGTTG